MRRGSTCAHRCSRCGVDLTRIAGIDVETDATTLRDLRIAEVGKLDLKIEDGKVVAYRARVSLSFKYEG